MRFEAAQNQISYAVSASGILTWVSEPAWSAFAAANEAPELTSGRVIGRRLEDFIAGEDVVASYHLCHQALVRRVVPEVSIGCQCDAAGVQRLHRLSIRLAEGRAGPVFWYTSTIVSETPRRPISVLERGRESTASPGLLKICSYCKRVQVPPGAKDGIWIPVEQYEALGWPDDLGLTHGLCAECRVRELDPLIALLRAEHQAHGPQH